VDLGRAVVLSEGAVRVVVVGTDEFFDYHEEQQGRVRFRYTIREGETLTSIGQRFELSVGSLARINRFARDTLLRPGEEIIVYAPRERVPARLLAEEEPEPAPTDGEQASSDDQDDQDEAAPAEDAPAS